MSHLTVLKARSAGHCHQCFSIKLLQGEQHIGLCKFWGVLQGIHSKHPASVGTEPFLENFHLLGTWALWSLGCCGRAPGTRGKWVGWDSDSQCWRSMLSFWYWGPVSPRWEDFRVYGFTNDGEMGRIDGETFREVEWCLPQRLIWAKAKRCFPGGINTRREEEPKIFPQELQQW